MAQPLCPLRSESWLLSPGWGPPPPGDKASGCSPASSPDPWDSGPAARAPTAGRRGSRLGSRQRQSASEREKLRMRTLARALHELRRFLPPAVAPAGQRLTKIETLRLAIRYIGHLSAVLGLSDDGLQRRRRRADAASPRGCCCCPLCPDGGPGGGPGSGGPSLGSAICHGATWESPPTRPRPRAAPEPCDLPVLNAECPAEPSPSSPPFPCEMLALLENWMPLSPQEWPPA
nr:mesoderm posterior protein 1 [Castor canadensis]